MDISSLEHLTADERTVLELARQVGPGPAIVIGDRGIVGGGLSSDFIASLHPSALLAAYRTAETDGLRMRLLAALLGSDDPLVDWYEVLRELHRPCARSFVIEGYDDGGTPEPKSDPAIAKVYDRLGLPAEARQDWEALLGGRTGENPSSLVSRLATSVADSAAGTALLLSQLNTGPTSPAWATLRNLVAHQSSGADPVETLLGIYAHRPWQDSACILVEAIAHCESRAQAKRVIAAAGGHPAVVAAAAERWSLVPEQLPTTVRTNPITPKT